MLELCGVLSWRMGVKHQNAWVWVGMMVSLSSTVMGQALREPDRGQPGDEMIQAYMQREAEKIDARFLEGIQTAEDWRKVRPALLKEYFYMLGLSPSPERTELRAKVTGTLDRDGYVVEKLHFQSRPGLYVTANLYKPVRIDPGKRLPAILYVCGHGNQRRNGNKTNYQAHGIWFAKHGYICLTLDTLQLSEIASVHHGTYREGRWWWHSRGYTPAGVECWNGIRGIDYLLSRSDVDPERIGVTGISGGGAATFWIAAADERVKVAAAVSGMADVVSYVPSRTINGHCDCMFLHNIFAWPWTHIAALVAPRPLLFVNSTQDGIFPMDANQRVQNRLERLYSLFGRGDYVDAVVSIGPHAYREDIRKAVFRFMNMHLKGDAAEVMDSEIDLVTEVNGKKSFPIAREALRVFPLDSDLPVDAINAVVDQTFVPLANVNPPRPGEFERWKAGLLAELRRVTFRHLPERIPSARPVDAAEASELRLTSEESIEFTLTASRTSGNHAERVWLVVMGETDEPGTLPEWFQDASEADDVYLCEPRGIGRTRWTRQNPPNYVERAHALLGQTVDTGRLWDIAAAARFLHQRCGGKSEVQLAGRGAAGVLAAYAALLEPEIAAAILVEPPAGHMSPGAPQFLNVLRVCDLADVLGMVAPRRLVLRQAPEAVARKTLAIYRAAGAEDGCTVN